MVINNTIGLAMTAKAYGIVDEPESSFDNLFLKSDVCKILKGISETMPVVVVTHNSTVGRDRSLSDLLADLRAG
jgi:ABC-type polar amino acid transport system ATPase subunit